MNRLAWTGRDQAPESGPSGAEVAAEEGLVTHASSRMVHEGRIGTATSES